MKFWKFSINGYPLILFEEWMDLSTEQIEKLTNEYQGIAAMGIVMMKHQNKQWHVEHYFKNGKKSKMNLNAIRCVAQHFMQKDALDYCQLVQENQSYICVKQVNGIQIQVAIPEQIERDIFKLGEFHRLFTNGILDTHECRFCTHQVRYFDAHSFCIESSEIGLKRVYDSAEGQIVAYYNGIINHKMDNEVMAIAQGGRSVLKYDGRSISISSRIDCLYEANYLKKI